MAFLYRINLVVVFEIEKTLFRQRGFYLEVHYYMVLLHLSLSLDGRV